MATDRKLVERIKEHFTWKSAAQLKQIADIGESDRWSAEAVVAANETLLDRTAGRANEPAVAEEDEPPQPPGHTVDSLAMIVGLNALALPLGFLVLPRNPYHIEEDPIVWDHPVPFGPCAAWLALDTTDTSAVATALGLRGARRATWGEGIAAAQRSSIFVTPPVGDWTLVVSAALFPSERMSEFVKPLAERLSRQFQETHYFCTHAGVGLHAWARARSGRLVRGFGWRGTAGGIVWNEGTITREERNLGLRFPREPDPEGTVGVAPEEVDVLQLAGYWSIDPNTLDDHFKEPVMGVLGTSL